MIKIIHVEDSPMKTNSKLVIGVGLAATAPALHSTGSFIFTPVIPETQTYLDSMTVYLRGVLTDNKENRGGSI
jgi:hypothetical protein